MADTENPPAFLPPGTPILDANDPDFARKLRDAIGVKPGERILSVTPLFNRTDGLVVPDPQDLDWPNMSALPEVTLKALGCKKWDEPDSAGDVIWLFPAEWYDRIPNGLRVIDINGNAEAFERGVTDDDRRYGVLAFGFKRKADAMLHERTKPDGK